jgi:hypothetical protein
MRSKREPVGVVDEEVRQWVTHILTQTFCLSAIEVHGEGREVYSVTIPNPADLDRMEKRAKGAGMSCPELLRVTLRCASIEAWEIAREDQQDRTELPPVL